MQLKMNGRVKKRAGLFPYDDNIHKNRSLHSKLSVYRCRREGFNFKIPVAEAHSHLYHLLEFLLWGFFSSLKSWHLQAVVMCLHGCL